MKATHFLDVPSRAAPDRRHSSEHQLQSSQLYSRNSSTTSVSSHKSEPGWLASMNGVDRSRTSSVTSTTSTKSSGGLGRLFGKSKDKPKKEKKDLDQIVLTSRHAAAVKTKLALDPKYKNATRKESQSAPRIVGTQDTLHMTAAQQEMRRPHSGPPAMYAPTDKSDMPVLTRIASGDEADEQDQWERLRQGWKQQKQPGVQMMQVLEGEAVDEYSSGNTTPDDQKDQAETKIPDSKVIEREGVRLLSVADIEPRPERHLTPIGGRWKKDEKGVWKR